MADYYSILASCSAIRDAYNRHDAAQLLAQYAPAFALIGPGQAAIEGPGAVAALREHVNLLFGRYYVYCAESVPYVTQQGGTAWVWGQERFRLVERRTGRVEFESYRVTRVWTQDAAGGWKITFQMQEPEPAATPTDGSFREQDPGIA